MNYQPKSPNRILGSTKGTQRVPEALTVCARVHARCLQLYEAAWYYHQILKGVYDKGLSTPWKDLGLFAAL